MTDNFNFTNSLETNCYKFHNSLLIWLQLA